MTRQPVPPEAMEQAAAWMFRLSGAPADAQTQAELRRWLDADDANPRAWDLAQRAWSLAGEAAPADPVRSAARPAVRAIRRLALPALAAALLIALLPVLAPRPDGDHRTRAAETRALQLADGSRLVLGADSAVEAEVTADRRGAVLRRGEAWFEVAPDPARPFTVAAADMTVTVKGTAFDIALTERTLSVALAHGAVEVARPGMPPAALQPGQRLDIDRQSGAMTVTAVDGAAMGAWRRGRIAVQATPLPDVVEALDRHFRGAIILTGDSLKARKVTGVYDLADPERALRAVIGPYGGTVRRITPWVIVVAGG